MWCPGFDLVSFSYQHPQIKEENKPGSASVSFSKSEFYSSLGDLRARLHLDTHIK